MEFEDQTQNEALEQLELYLKKERVRILEGFDNVGMMLAKMREGVDRVLQEQHARKSDAEARFQKTFERFKMLEDFVRNHQGTSAEDTERIEQLETLLNKKSEDMKAAEERVNQLEQEMSNTSSEAAGAKQRVAELEAQVKELEADQESVEDMQQKIKEIKWQLDDAEMARAQVEDQLANTREDLDKLRQESNSSQSDNDEALLAAQKELEELRQLKESEGANVDEYKSKAEQLQNEVEEVRSRYESELSEARSLLEQIETDSSEKVDASELEKLQARLQEAENKNQELEDRIKASEAKFKKSALAQQLADAMQEAEAAQAELEKLKAQLGQSDASPAPIAAANDNDSSLSEEQRIRAVTADGQKRGIGEILVQSGIITEMQFQDALEIQKENPSLYLGNLLVERNFASEDAVALALASQGNVPFVRFENDTVDPDAAKLITGRLAIQHTCIPIEATEETVTVAMVNPNDLVAIEDMEHRTNRRVNIVVSTESEIRAAINKFYPDAEEAKH